MIKSEHIWAGAAALALVGAVPAMVNAQSATDPHAGHHPGEVDEFQAEQIGEGLGDVPLGRQAQVRDDLAEAAPGPGVLALLLEGHLELLRREEPRLDEHVTEPPADLHHAPRVAVETAGTTQSGLVVVRHPACVGR